MPGQVSGDMLDIGFAGVGAGIAAGEAEVDMVELGVLVSVAEGSEPEEEQAVRLAPRLMLERRYRRDP